MTLSLPYELEFLQFFRRIIDIVGTNAAISTLNFADYWGVISLNRFIGYFFHTSFSDGDVPFFIATLNPFSLNSVLVAIVPFSIKFFFDCILIGSTKFWMNQLL